MCGREYDLMGWQYKNVVDHRGLPHAFFLVWDIDHVVTVCMLRFHHILCCLTKLCLEKATVKTVDFHSRWWSSRYLSNYY